MEKNRFNKLNILKKVLSISLKIFYDILIFLCVALIAVVVWQRVTDSNESIYGYRIFRIVSESMVPKYNLDEVVICKDVETEDLIVGDIIVYRGKTGELSNKLIMHEIIDINKNENNELIFYVKGIQNTTGDPDVLSNQVLGKVILKSKVLTLIYSLATSVYSSFIIITILVINVFFAFKPTKEEIVKLNEHNKDEEDDFLDTNILNENKESNEDEETNNVIESEESKENNIDKEQKNINNVFYQSEETEELKQKNKELQEENKLLKEMLEKINKSEETKKEENKN